MCSGKRRVALSAQDLVIVDTDDSAILRYAQSYATTGLDHLLTAIVIGTQNADGLGQGCEPIH